jgi:hypothetical protein
VVKCHQVALAHGRHVAAIHQTPQWQVVITAIQRVSEVKMAMSSTLWVTGYRFCQEKKHMKVLRLELISSKGELMMYATLPDSSALLLEVKDVNPAMAEG